MKKSKPAITPQELNDRKAQWLERCAEGPCLLAGDASHGNVLEAVEDDVRATSVDVNGVPAVAPELIKARALEALARRDQAVERVNAFFTAVRDASMSGTVSRPAFGWRGFAIVTLAAAIVGAARVNTSLRGIAVIVLSAALAVLVLPLVPYAVQVTLRAARAAAACVLDLGIAAIAAWRYGRLQDQFQAAENQTARSERWVAQQMGHLTAQYEYHLALVTAARAGNSHEFRELKGKDK